MMNFSATNVTRASFLLGAIAAASVLVPIAKADEIVDDFESGDFSSYTTTVILDNNGGGSNTSTLESVSGNVTLNTTAYDGIEQLAITRNNFTLEIGDELQLDVARGQNADRALRGDQDFGLYVGGSAPTTGFRADYLAVYQRDGSADVLSAVFNADIPEGNTNDFNNNPAYDSLFIARTGADTYEGGFYDGLTRTVIRGEVTIPTAPGGPSIGFYADVREAGVLQSDYDNLTIVRAPVGMATGLLNGGPASIVDSQALLMPSFTGRAADGGLFGRSINSVAHQTTPLVTFGDYQYATWYQFNSFQEHVMLGRRNLATGTGWEVFDTGLDLLNGDGRDDDKPAFQTQTQPWDNHNAINIGISGDGRIHLAYDHHSNPLNYLQSVAGAATGEWTRSAVFGFTNTQESLQDSFRPGDPTLVAVTYPRFATNPATGDMIATYRQGQSGAGDLFILSYDAQTGEWGTAREFITGNDGALYNDFEITGITRNSSNRNPYLNDISIGPLGSLHATFTWRETANGTANHGLNYITSNDNGLTWFNDSGDLIAGIGDSVSITSPGITIGSDTNHLTPGLSNSPAGANPPLGQIDRLQTMINQQGQTVDLQGGVHALMWHREDPLTYSSDDNAFDSREAAYFHYYKNPVSGQWSQSQIPRMDQSGNPLDVGSRPKIAYDEDGNVFAAFLSPGVARTSSRNYLDPGGLVIAGATKSSNYSDWSILSYDTTLYEGEPLIDQQRLLRDSVLSVLIQDTNFNQLGVTTSNLRVFDFAVRQLLGYFSIHFAAFYE